MRSYHAAIFWTDFERDQKLWRLKPLVRWFPICRCRRRIESMIGYSIGAFSCRIDNRNSYYFIVVAEPNRIESFISACLR